MQTRLLHGMVCRADPHECCDVGEFANGSIGNVGEAVAIGIIVEVGMGHSAPSSDLNVFSKSSIGYVAIWMKKGDI